MKKRAVLIGRGLLAIGASLSVVAMVEAHQAMSDAQVPETAPTATAVAPAPPSLSTMPDIDPPTANLDADPTATASPQAVAQARPAATEERESLAISAGNPGESGQNLAEMTANQIAATRNQWTSASFPLEQFQAYTSPFGYRRSIDGYNFNEFHYGLDLAAPRGSYIRNWWTGTVVEVSDDSNCGTSVVIEAGAWLSIYCHMEGYVEVANGERYMIDREGGLRIAEGSVVEAGERVGRVGMTGRTTGPHLHWGLKYDNNWVDPALVLRAMYSSQANASTRTN
jgi:murein DD-endopeptidase MepM/ murein hydrolase activator NlpD